MKNLFDFDKIEQERSMVFPIEIVKFQCEALKKITGDLIIGKVKEYDEPISDYTTQGLAAISRSIDLIGKPREIKIQSKLGEQSDSEFTYEFFITSKNMPNFIYRVCFIRYGISLYPVHLVVDETIAEQIGVNSDLLINNEDEFLDILAKILNCKKFKQVVENLYLLNMRLSETIEK